MARRTRSWIARGLLTSDGTELTAAGERQAEYEAEARAGHWDPPGDDTGPDGYGWAPNPFPDSAVI
jgi:hypothetical protein